MKRLSFLMLAACFSAVLMASSVTYTADNNTIFSNPERGFITMLTGHLTEKKPYGVKGNESTLDSKKSSEKMSIILVHYYLDSYKKTATLPSKVLNAFDEDMEVLRSKGMKAIIRFSYVDNNDNETAKDAAWSIAQQHINQYASHWQANADVIFCFQAGIVGAWGEWYYSENYGNKVDYMNDARRAVVDALLEAVPSDRCIQLRTPLFKTGYINSTKALTEAEAWKNTPKARLAHHNDAFLERWGDMGTYEDTATQKPYIAQETLYVPLGGESCILDEDLAATNASKENTIAEMSRLHWTFIQSGYSEVVTDMWRQNGTFDELNRRMGYRFQLVSASFSDAVAPGAKMSVTLNIKNTGFAPLYNARPVYIVLKNGSKEYKIKLAAEPRKWKPNGVVSTVSEQITIPSNVPEGTYQLYLWMPDAYDTLADKPAYAVRFANKDIWSSSTGMNNLKASVTIDKNAQDITTVDADEQTDGPMYDILGRPVDASFRGVVVARHKKVLQTQ